MNKIKSNQLAFSYAGCFIGAGFLSGQELWQFFGSFGLYGLVGLIIAIILQAVLGFVVVEYARLTKISEFDCLIVNSKSKILKGFFAFSEVLFIFFIITIMIAGAGSLFYSVLNFDKVLSALVFTIIVVFIALFGLTGVVKIFSFTVPVLTVSTIIVSVISLSKTGFPNIWNSNVTGKTVMLPNFIVSSILFAVHNLYCTLGVVAPIGAKVERSSTSLNGMSVSSIVLLLISLAVLLPVYANSDMASYDLPMLEIAKNISGVIYVVFVVLMAIGMFGTAVSNTVAICDFSSQKSPLLKNKKYVMPIVIGVSAFLTSNIGFSSLIAILYPLTGYVGVIAIILIIINYFKFLKKDKNNE